MFGDPPPLVYLQANDGSVWLCTVTLLAPPQVGAIAANRGPISLLPPGVLPAPYIQLNDIVTGLTWQLVVLPTATIPGVSGTYHTQSAPTNVPSAPTQFLLQASDGSIWAYQISNGILQTALPLTPPQNCIIPISVLADNVQGRLEEPIGFPGTFWWREYEIYSALVEAMNDCLLLVGRPTETVTFPITLAPNTVWQTLPKGLFVLTNLYGPQGEIRRTSLHAMDYVQAAHGPDWENTVGDHPYRWGPVGSNLFFIWPAPSTPIQVTITAIQYPAQFTWPYTDANDITVPFHHEFFVALEEYAVHYATIKEMGKEFQEGLANYQSYLSLAQRMTQIEDRRDPVLFSKSLGIPYAASPITKR